MAEVQHHAADNPYAAYERSDWRIGAIGFVALATLVLLVAAPLALLLIFPDAVPEPSHRLRIAPPPPRLQLHPASDLARLRAEEERRLNTYYWIDRERGIVHIPIEQAIKKAVAQGIDGFPESGR